MGQLKAIEGNWGQLRASEGDWGIKEKGSRGRQEGVKKGKQG
jgi:hypothetical protein